ACQGARLAAQLADITLDLAQCQLGGVTFAEIGVNALLQRADLFAQTVQPGAGGIVGEDGQGRQKQGGNKKDSHGEAFYLIRLSGGRAGVCPAASGCYTAPSRAYRVFPDE